MPDRTVALVCLLMVTCTGPSGDGERQITARELADEVIVPTLEDVATRSSELTLAIQALATAPATAELDAAQAAWRSARIPWKEADAFRFGPAKDLALAAAIDQAIQPARVDLVVMGTNTILQLAHVVADDFRARGVRDPEVCVDAFASLNGRRRARLIDPSVDLARESDGLGPKRWILPHPDERTPVTTASRAAR